MDRVARRLAQVGPGAEIGDPAPFIFGVAWRVTKEWIRRQRTVALPDGWDPADPGAPDVLSQAAAQGHDCLDRCLNCLCSQDKDVILSYYQYDGLAKIRSSIDGRSRTEYQFQCPEAENPPHYSPPPRVRVPLRGHAKAETHRVALTTGGCLYWK